MFEATAKYLEQVKREARPATAAFHEIIETATRERLLHRSGSPCPLSPAPVLFTPEEKEALQRDSVQLLRLLLSLPDRLFQGDYAAMCKRLGFTQEQTEIIGATFGDDVGILSRMDIFQGPEGFRFLECNVDSAIGGLEIGVLNELVRQSDYHVALAQDHWEYIDPFVAMVDSIKQTAAAKGLDPETMRMVSVDWYPDMLDY
ncbi:MAG: hypothetical protein ACXVDJ_02770, partial [Tumebacillaceae bacterium]